MEKIKVAKKIPFLLSVNYVKKEDTVEQIFSFQTTNKKYMKYAYDKRFNLRRKIEKAIDENVLELTFLRRDEDKQKITMVYENDGDVDTSAKIINCEFYLPPFNGCRYCKKAEENGDFIFCNEKKKHYELCGIKTCPVFQSVDEVIS